MHGRIALVPPRFGPGVVGGSEAVSQEIAVGLASRGWDVEVLTTCATNHYTWDNALPAGATFERDVVVRRFPIVPQWSEAARRAQLQIQDGRVPTLDEQVTWLGWRFTVPALYEHLLRRGHEYDAFLFSPYLFWTTTVCLPAVADRAISIPCLHDETYAHLDVARPVLADAARVWFLSEPEHRLAHRLTTLPAAHTVTGAGVDVPGRYEPERFRARYGLHRPFLAYIARREPEKGWNWLLEMYQQIRAAGGPDVDLVTAGVGDISVPDDLRGRVVDLGRISDEERNDCMAAALAYVQPSRMESFSRTTMEAWLAGTPVLAVEDGEVVAWHVERSGAGLLFRDGPTLAGAVRRLVDAPEEAAALGARGRQYVLDNYRWEVVLDRMEEDLEAMMDAGAAGAGQATGGAGGAGSGAAGGAGSGAAGGAGSGAGGPGGVGGAGSGELPRAATTGPGADDGVVLVLGSYPPVPAAGTPVTERIVADLRAAGKDPLVASYRVSAAALHARVAGPLAARRLANLHRVSGASGIVMVLERDAPLPTSTLPRAARAAAQRLVARTVARELRRFARVTLVVAGDLGADPGAWDLLAAAADEIRREEGDRAPLVGPVGPPELTPDQLARRALALAGRRLLGPAAPQVRAVAVRTLRSARQAARRH